MVYKKGSVTLRIREVMTEKNVASKAIVEALGINKVTVSNIVNGKTNPSLETVQRIAEVLGVPFWQLFASPDEVKADLSVGSPPVLTCPVCGASLHLTAEPLGGV